MTAKSRDIYSRVNQPGWNWAPALHKVNAIKSCSAPSLKPFSVPVQLLLQLALVNNNRQEHKMSLKLQQLAEDQRKLSTNGSIGSFLPTGKRNTSWCALNTYTLYTPNKESQHMLHAKPWSSESHTHTNIKTCWPNQRHSHSALCLQPFSPKSGMDEKQTDYFWAKDHLKGIQLPWPIKISHWSTQRWAKPYCLQELHPTHIPGQRNHKEPPESWGGHPAT